MITVEEAKEAVPTHEDGKRLSHVGRFMATNERWGNIVESICRQAVGELGIFRDGLRDVISRLDERAAVAFRCGQVREGQANARCADDLRELLADNDPFEVSDGRT